MVAGLPRRKSAAAYTLCVTALSLRSYGAPCNGAGEVCDYWQNGWGGDDDLACRAACETDGRWRVACAPCPTTPGALAACADTIVDACQ